MKATLLLFVIAVGFSKALGDKEPHCSKFPYEEQLLEKMVRMEFAVEKMKNEMEDARHSVRKTIEEFHEVKTAHEENIEKYSKHLKGNDDTPTAFTARLSSHLNNLGNNQPIVFDNILTNIGLAYSGTTGVFTAPKNGIYFFIATVMSHSNQYVQTEIVKNGQFLVKMYSYDKAHDQGTSGVVLQLDTSDEVWVRHLLTIGDNVYGNNWSTFSGFQIEN